MTAFEAHTSRAQIALQLGACVMFIAIGALMVWNLGVPAGWLVIAGFAVWFAFVLPRMFRLRLELRIDANGVWGRRRGGQTVPWSQIDRLRVLNMNQTRAIYLWLAEGARPSRKRQGLPDMMLRLTGTDRKFPELLGAMRAFAPASVQWPETEG